MVVGMKVVSFLDMMKDTTTQKKPSEELTTKSGRSLKTYNIDSIPTDMPTIYQDEKPPKYGPSGKEQKE